MNKYEYKQNINTYEQMSCISMNLSNIIQYTKFRSSALPQGQHIWQTNSFIEDPICSLSFSLSVAV